MQRLRIKAEHLRLGKGELRSKLLGKLINLAFQGAVVLACADLRFAHGNDRIDLLTKIADTKPAKPNDKHSKQNEGQDL